MDFAPYQDVYANLVASAVWAVGTRLVGATSEAPYTDRERVADIFSEAREAAARLAAPERISDDIGGERLRAFLLSAEARDIAMGVCLAQAVESEELRETLRRRFVATMSWFTRLPESQLRGDANRLVAAIESAMKAAATALGELKGGRTNEGPTLQLIAAEAANAAVASTALIDGPSAPGFDAVFEFEQRYRRAVRAVYGRIEPPNHEGSTLAVEDLYVDPRFVFGRRSWLPDSETDADDVIAGIHRTVVLGNPGAGKSSFARATCYRISAVPSDDAEAWAATPFLVTLKDYAARKSQAGVSIVGFIRSQASSSFQVDPPENAIEYLLNSGRALVVFDGLDELTDTHSRRAIRDDVDAFAELYPFTRILVTSRERGYQEAPLDDRRFVKTRILDFDGSQTREYVYRWFGVTRHLSGAELDDVVDAFLEESDSAGDLVTNPLMLALMCSIYKRRNSLPRSRAAIYEQCAETLFDRWDRSRRIPVERPTEGHLIPLLQYIAHWIFESEQLQAGVTAHELTNHSEQYFLEEVTRDPIEAREMAKQFVEFCHGRGWVLVAVDRNTEDDELYEFAHRTFLEFFTAGWYAGSDCTTEELANLLLDHVAHGEWEMIASLAIQLRNRAARNSATDVLRLAVDRGSREGPVEAANILALIARVYEFHTPRSDISERVGALVLETHVELMLAAEEVAQRHRGISDVLWGLRRAQDASAHIIAGMLRAACEPEAWAFTTADNLNHAYAVCADYFLYNAFDEDELLVANEYWDLQSETLLLRARESEQLAVTLHASGRYPTERLIADFGVDWALDSMVHSYTGISVAAYTEHLLAHATSPGETSWNPQDLDVDLRLLGSALAAKPLPWIDPYVPSFVWFLTREIPDRARADDLSPDAFAALIVCAMLCQAQLTAKGLANLDQHLDARTDTLSKAWRAIRSGDRIEIDGASNELVALATLAQDDPSALVGAIVAEEDETDETA